LRIVMKQRIGDLEGELLPSPHVHLLHPSASSGEGMKERWLFQLLGIACQIPGIAWRGRTWQ
jgi:hypothetical protein